MTPEQSDLFALDACDTAPHMSDHDRERELLRDVSAAADILAMGSDGIAAHVSLRLRGELVTSIETLAQFWHVDVSA